MDPSPSNNWFGIRAIDLFGQKKDGTNIFEARVVFFSTGSAEAMHACD
jgi:hypothetical protein